MTTRKEDAGSIIGEELAEELDKEAKLVGKSEALVIKADEEVEKMDMSECHEGEAEEDCRKRLEALAISDAEPGMELASSKADMEDDEEEEDEEEKPKKKGKKVEEDKEEKSLISVQDIEKMGEGVDLAWKPFGGATSMKEAQAVIEAKKEQYRMEDMWWMFQDVANNIMSDPGIADKGKAIASAASEFKTMLGKETSKAMTALLTTLSLVKEEEVVPVSSHPLDSAFAELKAQFDAQVGSGASEDDVLRVLQEPYSAIGLAIKSAIQVPVNEPVSETQPNDSATVAVQQLSQQIGLLLTKMDDLMSRPAAPVAPNAPIVPPRRNISAQEVARRSDVIVKSKTPTLRSIIENTTR